MSDKELEVTEEEVLEAEAEVEEVEAVEEDSIDEAKASHGDPSEVPDPTTKQAAPPKTKAGMIQAMVGAMNGKKKDELTAAYAKIMNDINGDDDDDDDVKEEVATKEPIKVSPEDIDLSKDVEALFGDEELSEEFKEKATTIFEAAVIARINETVEKLGMTAEADAAEVSDSILEETTTKVDEYLDYVVSEWVEDNKLAIEHGVRSQMVESFMSGLKGLFEEHYVDIPEEKVDVVDELIARVDTLEKEINDLTEENVTLKSSAKDMEKKQVFVSVSDDLTESQKEEFEKLADGVEFKDSTDYTDKLGVIKETYFAESSDDAGEVVSDDDETPLEIEAEEAQTITDPAMASYMASISRTVRK
tara:strand:- start:398 stop:1480 length:1083 start_codon:yes stop_codon:yes gene_type:complete